MANKAFIARDESGVCLIMSEKPVFRDGTYYSSGGSVADFHPTVALILGVPFPKPGEMIEWPQPAQTEVEKKDCSNCGHFVDKIFCEVNDGTECYSKKTFRSWVPRKNTEPEPPAETLVPITSLEQLRIFDTLRSGYDGFSDICAQGFSCDGRFIFEYVGTKKGEPLADHWSLRQLIACGYRQVITAPRTLNREEARKAIKAGKSVKCIENGTMYRTEGSLLVGEWEANGVTHGLRAIKNRFDLPEGRYEIVGGE